MSRQYSSSTAIFLAGLFFLFLIRWPGWFAPYSLNLDEELLLASVTTMKTRGIVPWVSFDTTTIGPVPSWFLYGVEWVVGKLDYQTIHTVNAILWAISGLTCVVSVFLLFSWKGAAVAFFVTSVTFLMTLRFDYLHFNSGILPSLCLSLAMLVLVALRHCCREKSTRCALFALCGLLCGLAVFGKLQAGPISLFIFCAAGWLIISEPRGQRFVSAASLIFGASLLPLSLGLWLWMIGELGVAWNSYFVAGMSYGSNQTWNGERISSLRHDIWNGWAFFRPFLITIALILVACPGARPTRMNSHQAGDWVLFFGWLIFSLVAVAVPVERWEHHGTLLISPSIVFLSYLISKVSQGEFGLHIERWKILVTSTTLSLVWLLFSLPHLESLNFRQLLSVTGPSPWHRSLFQRISDESRGDSVAVWGWVPAVFADMNLSSATRHMISHFLIDENPAREALRKSYMEDIQSNPPAVFLDAVCEGFFLWKWTDHHSRRVDSFPELHEFLNTHYDKTITKTYPAHIYVLKERFR
jgi:hypothetical protein